MAIVPLAEPLPLNVVTPGTEEDNWGEPINDNWVMIRQKVVDLIADLGDKADLVGGVIPSDQMPALSAISVIPVADEAARVALSSATVGTAVLQIDDGTIYVLTTAPYSVDANWSPVNTGTALTSINGETGPVVTGYLKTATNDQTVTATGFTFSNPVVVANATSDTHAVNRGQLNTAIAGVGGGSSLTKQSFLVGNGSATSFNVDHNRNSLGVMVWAQDVDTGDIVDVHVNHPAGNLNRAVVTVTTAPATNKLRLWVLG